MVAAKERILSDCERTQQLTDRQIRPNPAVGLSVRIGPFGFLWTAPPIIRKQLMEFGFLDFVLLDSLRRRHKAIVVVGSRSKYFSPSMRIRSFRHGGSRSFTFSSSAFFCIALPCMIDVVSTQSQQSPISLLLRLVFGRDTKGQHIALYNLCFVSPSP